MEQPGRLIAAGAATDRDVAAAAGGHPRLLLFDRVRALLVASGLPPEPEVYDLLWRHVGGMDRALSAAVTAALDAGGLDMAAVAQLRRAHCGDVPAEQVAQLVAAAHAQASGLLEQLSTGQADLAEYDAAIASCGAAIAAADDRETLRAAVARLAAATAVMTTANRQLTTALATAADKAEQLRSLLHAAETAAVTDPLTGLLNRRGILAALAKAQSEARAAAGELAVAMIDIDHFKRVNDRWGHLLGDEVLRFVARHIDTTVGAGGKIGRFGGEEFVAVLPGCSLDAGTRAIDTSRAALAGQIIRRSNDGTSMGRVTFSAGIAANRADEDAEALIDRADKALYLAKHLGRDRVVPDRS